MKVWVAARSVDHAGLDQVEVFDSHAKARDCITRMFGADKASLDSEGYNYKARATDSLIQLYVNRYRADEERVEYEVIESEVQ